MIPAIELRFIKVLSEPFLKCIMNLEHLISNLVELFVTLRYCSAAMKERGEWIVATRYILKLVVSYTVELIRWGA
jgi:hypothetical protein